MKEWTIVYAEDGEDFQQYVNKKGVRIRAGKPIGIEKGDKLILLDGVYFSND